MNRIFGYIKKNNCRNIVRKIFSFLIYKYQKISLKRVIKSYVFFGTTDIELGLDVRIRGFSSNVKFEKGCVIYDNCILEFSDIGELNVGENFVLSYGSLICCRHSIRIGNNVQIGEYTSIRDSTHDHTDMGVPMKFNPDIVDNIVIGDNVWIGRGCVILPGTIIESDVVIGANSVVKGLYEKNSINAGSVAKFIRNR